MGNRSNTATYTIALKGEKAAEILHLANPEISESDFYDKVCNHKVYQTCVMLDYDSEIVASCLLRCHPMSKKAGLKPATEISYMPLDKNGSDMFRWIKKKQFGLLWLKLDNQI